jgi:peptidyl-dipeptidase A
VRTITVRTFLRLSLISLLVGSVASAAPAGAPTVEEARRWVADAEQRIKALAIEGAQVGWVAQTFITVDTQAIQARFSARAQAEALEVARAGRRFKGLALDRETARKLKFLVETTTAPSDPALQLELAQLGAALDADYSRHEPCLKDGRCLDFEGLARLLATDRDPAVLLEAWRQWHTIGATLEPAYARFVTVANQGARDAGYADLGAAWRAGYDMPPDEFAAEMDRLNGQIQPLYKALHCHVRAKLRETYGDAVPERGPIPVHLTGNMWGQQWNNLWPLLGVDEGARGYDLTAEFARRGIDEAGMVRIAEKFFLSLGYPPLPETFWERSLIAKPADHDAVCYASAHHVDYDKDVRLKQCVQRTEEDLKVLHHELGHTYYQLAYREQPFLFRDSANDGFHEAVGDTLSLSMTPSYLSAIGLIERAPSADPVPFLLRSALDNVVAMPWTYGLDQWRWQVLSGATPTSEWNAAWWAMRRRLQGIGPGEPRDESDFDPGAKYHVPANVPYTRYFLSTILRFQLHESLCKAAGHKGPLHECSIYGSKPAGAKLQALMAMGSSQPWQDALQQATGSRRMDARAVLEYYAPLKTWLDQQNRGRTCGW